MTSVDDRAVARLLSALAEVTDVPIAGSRLLERICEITRTRRACLLCLDANRETLASIAAIGFDDPDLDVALSIGDLSNPIVVSTLSLTALRGRGPLGARAFEPLESWAIVPLWQPRTHNSVGTISPPRAADIVGAESVRVSALERRRDAAPAGAVLFGGPVEDAAFDEVLEIVTLASPVIARLASLAHVRERADKLEQQNERFMSMIDSLPDPVVITNRANAIVAHNHRADRLLRHRDDDAPNRRRALELNNLLFTSFLARTSAGNTVSGSRELNLVDPDEGKDLLFEVLTKPLSGRPGLEDAALSVLRDVTDVRRASHELERQVQWQSQEVERANKLKSEFLASMSHELRTPINALIGYSTLLLDNVLGDLNPRQQDALARSLAAAEHLLALINDILDLAKIEAGQMPLHLEDVPLRELMLEVTQQIEPMVRKKQLDFAVEVASDCPVLYTDRSKVKQILLNLLSNAVKFTSRGRVAVEAQCTPAGVRIDVIDSGIGIRDADLQSIWEDFRQVDQSRTREFGGTGLGLSITRKLLERLGGSVTVQSRYGEGSTFSVYLPLRVPSADLAQWTPSAAKV